MRHFLIAGLLLCVTFSVGCTTAQENTSEAARESGPTLTDSDLESQIEARINSDAALRGANISVDADAERNTATLSGTVETQAMRTNAVEMARAAHPGLTVEDKIDVKPREIPRSEYTAEQAREEVERAKANNETVGSSLDDAWIHAKVVAQLIGDTNTPERKINVDVRNNVVTLRGTVDTQVQKEEAERIAKQTEGVKSVTNQLRVAPVNRQS